MLHAGSKLLSSCISGRIGSHVTRGLATSARPYRGVMLFTPASSRKFLQKTATLSMDSIIMDIEDGVATNMKEEARNNLEWAVDNLDFGKAEILGLNFSKVRINSVDSGLIIDDLKTIAKIQKKIHGLVIPKVEGPKHLERVRSLLAQYGNAEPAGHLKFLAGIESARSIIDLKDICQYAQSPKLDALLFSAEDYCANTGITRTPGAAELLYARSAVVNHAVAYDIHAIDMVCINYKDPLALIKEAKEGCELGFHGKQAINPVQIQYLSSLTFYLIRDAFKPSETSIAFAKKVIEGNQKHQAEGRGAFELEGKMIDAPVVRAAQNILHRANINEQE